MMHPSVALRFRAAGSSCFSRNFHFDFANTRFVFPYPTQRQVAIRLKITTGSGLRR